MRGHWTFTEWARGRVGFVIAPMIAIVAYLNAVAVSSLVGIYLAPAQPELAGGFPPRVNDAPKASQHATSAASILTRNPFDHVTGSLAFAAPTGVPESIQPEGDPSTAPSCDGIDVFVIAASKDSDYSFAALSTADHKTFLRRRGGEVGTMTVVFVGVDRVWLRNGGALCQAVLFDRKSTRTKQAPAPPVPSPPARGGRPLDPELKKGIARVGPTEFNIDRSVVDKILENQADLMRQARVVPVQENGHVVGVRLVGIRPDSLLSTLGMENGDRLDKINGFELGSPEKALEAYARLRTADKLTIQLSRGGKPMNLDYNIK